MTLYGHLFKCTVRASGKIRKPEKNLFRPLFVRGRKYSSRRAVMTALSSGTSCSPEDDLLLQGLSGRSQWSGSGICGSSGMEQGLPRSQNMSPCCRQKKVRKTLPHPDSSVLSGPLMPFPGILRKARLHLRSSGNVQDRLSCRRESRQ